MNITYPFRSINGCAKEYGFKCSLKKYIDRSSINKKIKFMKGIDNSYYYEQWRMHDKSTIMNVEIT